MAKKFLAGFRSTNVRGIEGLTAILKIYKTEDESLVLALTEISEDGRVTRHSEEVRVESPSQDTRSGRVHAKLLELAALIDSEHYAYPDDPSFIPEARR